MDETKENDRKQIIALTERADAFAMRAILIFCTLILGLDKEGGAEDA